MYVHMCSTKVYWAAITSYHKWVFLRRTEEPATYTYSTVEIQSGNPRPFMTLLAIILAADGHITVPLLNVGNIPLDSSSQSQAEPGTGSGDSAISSIDGTIRTDSDIPSNGISQSQMGLEANEGGLTIPLKNGEIDVIDD